MEASLRALNHSLLQLIKTLAGCSLKLLGLLGVVLSLSACKNISKNDEPSIAFCDEKEKNQLNIAATELIPMLQKTQQFSLKIYGNDCVVCAEILETSELELTLHITSPDLDEVILFNTSAYISFNKKTGSTIEKGVWHSCKVRFAD